MNSNDVRRKWLTAYAPLAIWTILIIGLGSSLGAMNETSRFIRPLLEFIFPTAHPETLSLIHGYIRKAAHLAEYAILAVLAVRALSPFRFRFIFAICVVIVVASIDEFNQSFNPERTGTPFDVLIDLVGGSIGLGVWWLFAKFRSRRAKPSPEPRG